MKLTYPFLLLYHYESCENCVRKENIREMKIYHADEFSNNVSKYTVLFKSSKYYLFSLALISVNVITHILANYIVILTIVRSPNCTMSFCLSVLCT